MRLNHDIRALRLLKESIRRYSLDLTGLTVFTEAATGPYQYTSILCCMAGAKQVYALGKDTRWGTIGNTAQTIKNLAQQFKCENTIHFLDAKDKRALKEADIITNSGNIRPIDDSILPHLKPTCVIPLMWETWEHRPQELNLEACRNNGILVLGTDEEAIRFRKFTGIMYLRTLLDCGLEIYRNRYLVMSSTPLIKPICSALEGNGAEVRWTSLEQNPDTQRTSTFIPPMNREALLNYLRQCDACICDDRSHHGQLIGNNGLFSAQELHSVNSNLLIINRSGMVDVESLRAHSFTIFPDRENRLGFPNMLTSSMGIAPTIELVSAGICVGQSMARARLAGLSVEEAAKRAIAQSPAQDFPGDKAWIPN